MAAGCTKSAPPPPKPVEKPKTPRTVVTDNPEATAYTGDGADRHPIWNIKGKTATASAVNDVPTLGEMQVVSGTIFQQKDTKDFKADKGLADNQKKILTLTGNVSVYSQKQGSHLTCDKLVYNAGKKIFDARGNVTVKSKTISINGVPAAIADENLDQIASPEMFQEKNAGK